jgi:hypothetical protein
MQNALKSLENNALAALTQRAPAAIVNAIQTASAKTGVSFSYLMEKAAAESNFNPTIKARTSSATGLFQFIESTWMDMVKRHGSKYGINTNQSRQSLLNLRKDPSLASFMAAEFARDNKNHLEQTVGGDIGNTELYFAHFMGAGGASAFLSQLKKNPLNIAADLFPAAARANRNVFYDSQTGQPRTLQQVYDFFDKKFTDSPDITVASNETMAHKPRRSGSVYQHIPPSLKDPIRIVNSNAYSHNSVYQVQNHLDAFFSQPVDSTGIFPTSLYGNLAAPTSMLLNVLKLND